MSTWFLDEIETWEVMVFCIGCIFMGIGLGAFIITIEIFYMVLFAIGFLLVVFGVVYSGNLVNIYNDAMDA